MDVSNPKYRKLPPTMTRENPNNSSIGKESIEAKQLALDNHG